MPHHPQHHATAASAVSIAQTVAPGDLSPRIAVTGKDETSELLQALKNMNYSLLKIVGKVRTGTDAIAITSIQIAAGNLDLSSRTEEQPTHWKKPFLRWRN